MKLFRRESSRCPHVPSEIARPTGEACLGCGSRFNLRSCAECGYVACCESQRAHNRQHAREAGHPVIVSLPLGPHSFTWCYECASYVDAGLG